MIPTEQLSHCWKLSENTTQREDRLLEALIVVAKIYQKSASADGLTAGLPLENNKLTLETLPRAAKKAGLKTNIYDISLEAIKPQHLPAILLFKDNTLGIVTAINQHTYQLVKPGIGIIDLTLAELTTIYQHKLILLTPEFKLDKRTSITSPFKYRHWFWSTMMKALPLYGEIVVASLLINLFVLASPLFVMNVYDRVVPNNATATLWALASGVIIVFIFDGILKVLRGYFIDVASKKIDAELSSKIFEKILGLKLSALPKSVGNISNMVYSFEAFREFITSTTISLLIDTPFVIIFVIVIWYIGGTLFLIPATIIPLVLITGYLVQLPINNLILKSYRVAAQKQATLLETLHGIETIKSSASEGIKQREWESITCQHANITQKLKYYNSLGSTVCTFLQSSANVLLIIVGVYLIASGKLTMGALIACTILTGRAIAPMTQVSKLITKYKQTTTALHSLNDLMHLPDEKAIGKNQLQTSKNIGSISFEEVDFAYPEQKFLALNKVSFKISAGEKIGIIGQVGSGKSSIVKLITGLYEPTAGKVMLDGLDMQQLDLTQLRKQIAYVSQEPILFYGSIRDNIALQAPYATDEAILKAANISGIYEFIRLHPDGFDMIIEEEGKNLSGGQRQMIAIARAFVHAPPIILLDEPTSAMDDKASNSFKNILRQELRNSTVVMITHRNSMLNLISRIIVLDKGNVIADGPKNDILQQLHSGKLTIKS